MKSSEGEKLSQVTKLLSATAMGNENADLVIKNGKIVNVNTGEIELGKDIAIKAGRIAFIGDADHTIGDDTNLIDATDYYLAPGFMDGHVHVESSMITVTQFARAVLPRGTTTIFMDPHEIANVLGMDGVKLMIEEGKDLPLRVLATMPSCVPAAPGFEDAGASFGPDEISQAMEWSEVVGLGEMMNFPGVLFGDSDVHGELRETLNSGKIITGHYSIPDIEKGLQAYAAAGISSCHEGTSKEDAISRMRLGMYAKMREGSAWHDVKENIKAITESNIDTRFGILVSDDVHPHTLLEKGHLDHVVRRAIQEGVDPITAIQMVTINTAQCFEVDRFMGSISPGRYGDILFIKDLAEVNIEKVISNGELIYEKGNLSAQFKDFNYPDYVTDSVKIPDELFGEDFQLKAKNTGTKTAEVSVMEIMEASVGTKHRVLELPVNNGIVQPSVEQDVIKVIVMERHGKSTTKNYGVGFAKGFGLKEGAVASTVAHDSHNLLIMGTNDEDMAYAGNVLAEKGGGMVAIKDKKVLALIPLKIAGLMSDEPVEKVATMVDEMDEAWKELGCSIESPFMTMALLSLPVLPELRLTNRGLVDTLNFKIIDSIK